MKELNNKPLSLQEKGAKIDKLLSASETLPSNCKLLDDIFKNPEMLNNNETYYNLLNELDKINTNNKNTFNLTQKFLFFSGIFIIFFIIAGIISYIGRYKKSLKENKEKIQSSFIN